MRVKDMPPGMTSSTGWKITGYYLPDQADFSGDPVSIQVVGEGTKVFPDNFLSAVQMEGWARTSEGWFLGWNGNWISADQPLNAIGTPLHKGSLAVDSRLIKLGQRVRIPSAPDPWAELTFIADDHGGGIVGKHVDIYCGIGAVGKNETYRVTSDNGTVSFGPIDATKNLVAELAQVFADKERLADLIRIGRDPYALGGAKQIAGSVVHGDPANQYNTCATTLSCLLDFAGIYIGVREAVLDLASYLENDRGWVRIQVGQQIAEGDIGVVIVGQGSSIHHIYLIIDASDQTAPIVADNQGRGSHPRPVAGGDMPGVGNSASATSYFLRAP